MARDLANDEKLEALGWKVLRFWESAIKSRPTEVVEEVAKAIAVLNIKELNHVTEALAVLARI